MTQFRGRGFGLSWSNKNGSNYKTRILKSFSERWKRYPNSKAILNLARSQAEIDAGKRYHAYIYPQRTITDGLGPKGPLRYRYKSPSMDKYR